MATTLKNNSSNQTFHGTYYPSVVGRRTSDKLYDVQKVRSPRGKNATIKQPYSFMVLPGETKQVHDVALHLPQVKAARKSGWLEVVAEAPPAKAKPVVLEEKEVVAVPAPKTESEGSSRKRGR